MHVTWDECENVFFSDKNGGLKLVYTYARDLEKGVSELKRQMLSSSDLYWNFILHFNRTRGFIESWLREDIFLQFLETVEVMPVQNENKSKLLTKTVICNFEKAIGTMKRARNDKIMKVGFHETLSFYASLERELGTI